MTVSLAKAMCDGGLAMGYAEVRRYIDSGAVQVNGEPARSWNQLVYVGDIIKVGSYRSCVVK